MRPGGSSIVFPARPWPTKRGIAIRLGRHRRGYFLVARRRRLANLLVDVSCDVVIEGYPRSGNTFAVVAFEYAQKRPVRMAHHHHSAAQVLEAVRLRLPTIVLLRCPIDAAASLLVRHPDMSPRLAVRWYIEFYKPLVAVRDHFVTAAFETVVTEYGSVIEKVNDRFSTDFTPFSHSPRALGAVAERIRHVGRVTQDAVVEQGMSVALPSAARTAGIVAARQRLQTGCRGPLAAADALYAHLRAGAIVPAGENR